MTVCIYYCMYIMCVSMYVAVHVYMYCKLTTKVHCQKSLRIAQTANIKRTKVFNKIHCNTQLSSQRENFLTRTFKN